MHFIVCVPGFFAFAASSSKTLTDCVSAGIYIYTAIHSSSLSEYLAVLNNIYIRAGGQAKIQCGDQ